jgi:hypothetical protein
MMSQKTIILTLPHELSKKKYLSKMGHPSLQPPIRTFLLKHSFWCNNNSKNIYLEYDLVKIFSLI